MPQTKRLQLVVSGMIRKRPYVTRFSVVWPWALSTIERTADEHASRGESLDKTLLAAVLEAKNVLTNAKRVTKR